MAKSVVPNISDEEISYIKRAQAGDDSAFTWIFNRYEKLVNGILLSYLKDEDEARDMTNVVFMRVHKNLDKFSSYDSFGGWLRIIANRIAVDYLRLKENQKYALGYDDDKVSEPDEYVENESVNRLEAEDIFEILDRYPPHVRKIFELHYINDLSVETVASKLRMPTGTVKSILSRVRNKLRKQLKKNP